MRFRELVFPITALLLFLTLACSSSSSTDIQRGPHTIKFTSGKQIQVVGITVTEMNFTDEKAAVLRYITEIDFDHDMEARRNELDGIWTYFRPIIEGAGIRVAVIEIIDNHTINSPLVSATKGRGIILKQDKYGEWNRPVEGDKGLVPKKRPGSP